MKLYYAPGVCSIGIHVLLEEIGKPYELETVNLREGAQHQPSYTQVSSKSKVPALQRDDGSILTEFPVIATYLAMTNPDKKLIPSDLETALRGYEAMEYAVGTMHGQGFARIFRPANFGPADQEDAVKARGREMVEKGFPDPRQGPRRQELPRRRRFFPLRRRGVLRRVLGRRPPQHETPRQRRRPLRAHEVAPRRAAHDAAGRRGVAARQAALTLFAARTVPLPQCGRGWPKAG